MTTITPPQRLSTSFTHEGRHYQAWGYLHADENTPVVTGILMSFERRDPGTAWTRTRTRWVHRGFSAQGPKTRRLVLIAQSELFNASGRA